MQYTPVYLRGNKNGSSGIIDNVSTSLPDFQDYVIATYFSEPGDSGGIVYGPYVNGVGFPVYGIHSGHSTSGSFFSKASNVASIWGITPY